MKLSFVGRGMDKLTPKNAVILASPPSVISICLCIPFISCISVVIPTSCALSYTSSSLTPVLTQTRPPHQPPTHPPLPHHHPHRPPHPHPHPHPPTSQTPPSSPET